MKHRPMKTVTCSGAKLKERMERRMIDIMIFNGWSKIGVGGQLIVDVVDSV